MSRPIKFFSKAVVERKRVYMDYSCWLEETETLAGFQVVINPATVEGPLVVNAGYTDVTNKKLVFFISGGVGTTDYIIQAIASTSAGQIKRDDIGIRVYP